MDFPHISPVPRREAARARFATLVASATNRHASQWQFARGTANAQGAQPAFGEIEGRIAFFGGSKEQAGRNVYGAFHAWASDQQMANKKNETAVNLDASANSKFNLREVARPKFSDAMRGMENRGNDD